MANYIFYDENGQITSVQTGLAEMTDEEVIKKFGFMAGKGRSVTRLMDADAAKVMENRKGFRYDQDKQKIIKI